MPALSEVEQDNVQHLQDGQDSSFPRSFAAVVKSTKFVEQEADKVREADRQKQERQARKVQEDRRKEEDRADREAAKEAEEARKKIEASEKRDANLLRLAEAKKQALDYKLKMKALHEEAQREVQESASYEKGIEELKNLKEKEDQSPEASLNPLKRPRPSSLVPPPAADQISMVPQN